MQLTESADAQPVSADVPRRLRLTVVDALFAAKEIVGPVAQARALKMHKSQWLRLREGEQTPLSSTLMDVADFLGTSVEAIYGRGR